MSESYRNEEDSLVGAEEVVVSAAEEHEEKDAEESPGATLRLTPKDSLESKLQRFDKHSETLLLPNSFLGDEGCMKVVDFVRSCKNLRTLDLRGNHIRLEGVKSVAQLLKTDTALVSLSLEWNSIGFFDQGVRALASALEVNRRLTHLDLRNNRIGPAGGDAIGSMLCKNKTLRSVDLRWNEIGSGGRSISKALLEYNMTLVECFVSGNKIPSSEVDLITQCIKRNMNPDKEMVVQAAKADLLSGKKSVLLDNPDALTRKLLREAQVKEAEKIVELQLGMQRAKSDLEALQKGNDVLRMESKKYQQQLQRLEELKASSEKQLSSENEHLRQELENERNTSALSRSDFMDREVKLRKELDELRTAFAAKDSELVQAKIESEKHKLDAENERNRVKVTENRLAEAVQRHEEARSTLCDTFKHETDSCKRRYETSKAEMMEELELTRKQRQQLSSDLSYAETKLSDALTKMEKTERDAERSRVELELDWKRKHSASEDRVKELEATILSLKEQKRTELEMISTGYETKLQQLRDSHQVEKDQVYEHLDEERQRMSEALTNVNNLSSELEKAKLDLKESNRQLTDAVNQRTRKEAELERLREENNSNMESLKDMHNQQQETLMEEKAKIQQDLEKTLEQLHEIQKKHKSIELCHKQEINKLHDALEDSLRDVFGSVPSNT